MDVIERFEAVKHLFDPIRDDFLKEKLSNSLDEVVQIAVIGNPEEIPDGYNLTKHDSYLYIGQCSYLQLLELAEKGIFDYHDVELAEYKTC